MIGAINQKLGRITGTQHHQWGIRNTNTISEPLKFKPWFMAGIEYYSKKGFVFELVCKGLLRIKRPGYVPVLRTLEDFQREYNEYVINFYL